MSNQEGKKKQVQEKKINDNKSMKDKKDKKISEGI